MKGRYEVTDGPDKRAIAEFLKSEEQFLLPMVELVDRAELAIDEVIEVIGRATIEAVRGMGAEAVAGPKQAGRARDGDDVVWYGRQRGQVYLSDRKVQIERPRLRRKGEIERRLDGWDLLVVYVDGIQFGTHDVLAAVGVDATGEKHVLGLRHGASEFTAVVRALLEDLVERGLDPTRRRQWVIDGSKALRRTIDQVFGSEHPVQRCRNHKLRNVLGHLPKDQHPQIKAAIRAAWKLEASDGAQKLEGLAQWLERDHPSAAASLREGLREMFTINRLGLPPTLRRCLGSTNIIDSTHSGGRQKTRRITNWKNGAMALRWAATAFVGTEKGYRKIIDYDQLWIRKAHLDDLAPVAEMKKASSSSKASGPPPSTPSGTPSDYRISPELLTRARYSFRLCGR